jgi:GNAT superfamily N-acetyltransferase
MITLQRTTSDHPDFKKLSTIFDEYLIDIDGEERDFFAFYNNVHLDHVVLIYEGKEAIGCGGFKEFDNQTAEIKRMFVHPDHRGKGIASLILKQLELWAQELHYTNFVLETSPKLEAAVALYQKTGYKIIPNFGQYIGVENSICLKKES